MTELKAENDTFYMLALGKDKRLYSTETEAIAALKASAAATPNLKPEEMNIFEVKVIGAKWEIKAIPWARIALGLIRAGGK